ncbi:YeeE/YedE thiosulfate transporter family protein [Alishewanella longhuensis]
MIVILLAIAAWLLHKQNSQLSFSLLSGAAFGYVIQRSRFCFYCISRDFIQRREARGLLGLIAALAVGLLGYHAVFGVFVPDTASGRLPPGAHIGAISWALVFGATAFGLGMALAGSAY